MKPNKPLMLNELTGKVHAYTGSGIEGPLSCGCELADEARQVNKLTLIHAKHLENGIWEEAECLKEVKFL